MLLKAILLLASSSLALFIFAFFYLRGKKTRLLYCHLACHTLVFIWLTGQLLETFVPDLQSKWVIVCFEYAAICFLGLAWLILSLDYTGHLETRKWKFINLLVILQVILYALMITNEWHHLFFQEFRYEYRVYGILFWLNVGTSYIYNVTGSALLIGSCLNKADCEKKQAVLLVASGMIPLVANGLYVFRIVDPGFDITPMSFFLSLLLLSFATFRYKLLNLMPIALRRVFDTLDEAVIVIDKEGIIAESNRLFKEMFQNYCVDEAYHDLKGVLGVLNKSRDTENGGNTRVLEALAGNKTVVNEEMYLTLPEKRCLRVNSTPVLEQGYYVGRLITFADFTTYRNLLDELKEKNVQLQEYACMVEKLAVMRERGRITRELHDTLAYAVFVMGNLMNESKNRYRYNPAEGEQLLARGIRIANEGMKEIRRLVKGLGLGPLEKGDLTTALQELAADTHNLGTLVEITITGEQSGLTNRLHSDNIYRICQEAITNSIRHGQATQVIITLEFKPEKIELSIQDDGQGCTKVEKGFGLVGMEGRVNRLQGRILYGPAKDRGFLINVEIPINEEKVND